MTTALGISSPTLFDAITRRKAGSSTIARSALAVVGFAVLTALLAQVRIGLGFTPVPITGQTLAVLLAGTTLGSRRGALSMGLYWLIGMVVPFGWYSNATHGWKVASGATAGYLFGFIVAAFVVGLLAERGQDRNPLTSLTAMLFGTFVVYVFGVAWLAHKLNVPVFDGDQNALTMGVVPFIAGDIVKLVIAGAVGPSAWRLVEGKRS